MSTRREFLSQTATGTSLALTLGAAEGRSPLREVKHVHLHGDRTTYCGHPRQGGLFYFGHDELVVLHNHATVTYTKREDVQHDWYGYHARSVLLLQRSTDGGLTWPGEDEVVVWDESAPQGGREKYVLTAFTSPRENIDLSKPESIVIFPRTLLGPHQYGAPQALAFALRSPDKGHHWERVPTLLLPPPGCFSASPDNTPVLRMPDGVLLFPMRTSGGRQSVDLYASNDNGLSWNFRTKIMEPAGYPGLVLLKNGRLQCYNYPLGMSYSDDGGRTWSVRKLIVPPNPSPWLQQDAFYQEELAHRSPFPMLLRDGRIVILFARRISPNRGIGLLVSEDGGQSWSPDIILRNDAAASSKTKAAGVMCDYSDIGYPLGAQLEDGRVFTAYYYITAQVEPFGGPRFIAGTFFRLT
jgi:hypothetical protein